MKIAPKKPTLFRTEPRTKAENTTRGAKAEARHTVDGFDGPRKGRNPLANVPTDFIGPRVKIDFPKHEPVDLIDPSILKNAPTDFIGPRVKIDFPRHEPVDLINPEILNRPQVNVPTDFIGPRVKVELPKAEPLDFIGPRLTLK